MADGATKRERPAGVPKASPWLGAIYTFVFLPGAIGGLGFAFASLTGMTQIEKRIDDLRAEQQRKLSDLKDQNDKQVVALVNRQSKIEEEPANRKQAIIAGVASFETLPKRVELLEKEFDLKTKDKLALRVDALEKQGSTTAKADITAFDTKITAITTDLTTLKEGVSTLKTKVDVLKTPLQPDEFKKQMASFFEELLKPHLAKIEMKMTANKQPGLDALVVAMHSEYLPADKFNPNYRRLLTYTSADLSIQKPDIRIGLALGEGILINPIVKIDEFKVTENSGSLLAQRKKDWNAIRAPGSNTTDRMTRELAQEIAKQFPAMSGRSKRCVIVASAACSPPKNEDFDAWGDLEVNVVLVPSLKANADQQPQPESARAWSEFCKKQKGQLVVLPTEQAGDKRAGDDTHALLEIHLRRLVYPILEKTKEMR